MSRPGRLLEERVILIEEPVDDRVANAVIAQLLFLDRQDPSAAIKLGIDSAGGSLSSALAVRDVVRHISAPVVTLSTGSAVGPSCLILASARRGARWALPGAKIALSEPRVSWQGTPVPPAFETTAREYVELSGRGAAEVEREMAGGTQFEPKTAMAWGLIDGIWTGRS